MKEEVAYTLHGINPPNAEFRGYYQDRNGQIAADIAEFLGVPFVGEVTAHQSRRESYMVPVKTADAQTAEILKLGDETEFYGAKVRSMDMVGKAILHPTPSEITPEFYLPEFAQYIAPLVLPGATAFSREDAAEAYRNLVAKGHTVRMKMPNASDGNGQYSIGSEEELTEILSVQDVDSLKEHGIVLEANVRSPKTISVGYARIGFDLFSFIAEQKNNVVEERDELTDQLVKRDRYAGAKVRVIKGGVENLRTLEDLSAAEKEAVETCIAFCEAYKQAMGVVASRLSFDYLYGKDMQGNPLAGITDITGRLGGTCPAIMVAIAEFKAHKRMSQIDAEVTLNYNPSQQLEEERGAKRYIDRESLRLTARVNTRTYR